MLPHSEPATLAPIFAFPLSGNHVGVLTAEGWTQEHTVDQVTLLLICQQTLSEEVLLTFFTSEIKRDYRELDYQITGHLGSWSEDRKSLLVERERVVVLKIGPATSERL